jgi:hypothetical protein
LPENLLNSAELKADLAMDKHMWLYGNRRLLLLQHKEEKDFKSMEALGSLACAQF